MKRVILTGATGFVGSNLARRLIHEGHEVHALVRQAHRSWRIQDIRKELAVHPVDLSNKDEVFSIFSQIQPDWIFHTAVYGAYSHQDNLDDALQTNIVGTSHLLQAAISSGFECFVNTGSSSEYGFKDHAPMEEEAIDPNSYYAVTKAAATQLCRYVASREHLQIPTLRLYSVYGPYEEPTRLLPTLLRFVREKRLPPLVDPSIARDYIYIDDVIDAYLAVAEATLTDPGAIYNVGSEKQTTLHELVETSRTVFDVRETPKWGSMKSKTWDTTTWVSSTQKIQREVGWKAQTTVADGMSKFSQWMESHLDWYKIAKDNKRLEAIHL